MEKLNFKHVKTWPQKLFYWDVSTSCLNVQIAHGIL